MPVRNKRVLASRSPMFALFRHNSKLNEGHKTEKTYQLYGLDFGQFMAVPVEHKTVAIAIFPLPGAVDLEGFSAVRAGVRVDRFGPLLHLGAVDAPVFPAAVVSAIVRLATDAFLTRQIGSTVHACFAAAHSLFQRLVLFHRADRSGNVVHDAPGQSRPVRHLQDSHSSGAQDLRLFLLQRCDVQFLHVIHLLSPSYAQKCADFAIAAQKK